jgi:hypothetical protein
MNATEDKKLLFADENFKIFLEQWKSFRASLSMDQKRILMLSIFNPAELEDEQKASLCRSIIFSESTSPQATKMRRIIRPNTSNVPPKKTLWSHLLAECDLTQVKDIVSFLAMHFQGRSEMIKIKFDRDEILAEFIKIIREEMLTESKQCKFVFPDMKGLQNFIGCRSIGEYFTASLDRAHAGSYYLWRFFTELSLSDSTKKLLSAQKISVGSVISSNIENSLIEESQQTDKALQAIALVDVAMKQGMLMTSILYNSRFKGAVSKHDTVMN